MAWVLGLIGKPIFKYLVGALAAALIMWYAVHRWDNYKAGLIEQGRKAGYSQAITDVKKEVAANDKTNRTVETRVNTDLNNFDTKLNSILSKVTTKETKAAGTILSQINAHPQIFNNRACDTPPETINTRNAIRALGPPASNPPVIAHTQVFTKATHNADGSVDIPLK